jgi:hypothetical protein
MLAEPRVRLGGHGEYVTLWEWHLKGTNRQIGRAFASWGREQFRTGPVPCPSRGEIAAQRRFFARFYPSYYERMIGVADVFGLPVDEGAHDLSSLWFDVGIPGCSTAFVPGGRMVSGHHHVLRNMDFGVNLSPQAPFRPSSRIMAIDTEPDEGYASLAMVVFDLMGAMDGINEKGLVVVCNSRADHRLDPSYKFEPDPHPQPGLNELQLVRYLLDTCADIEEAKDALLSLRWYYSYTPCLYLVADARGRALVCHKSASGNRICLTEREGEPLVMTNFSLTRFSSDEEMPEEDGREKGFVYTRYRAARDGIESSPEPLSTEQLAAIAESASFDVLTGPRSAGDDRPDRTIWTGIYDIEKRRMLTSCYLGEREDGTNRSEFVELSLGGSRLSGGDQATRGTP